MAKKTARVTGTRSYTIKVDLPHTILIDEKTHAHYFTNSEGETELGGLWNADLDFIKEQLPSENSCFNEVLKIVSEGKVENFECGCFSPKTITWEEN
tara:strand:+ start:709 stop:999 length:291 start_codon:yes stop_codon:yes gene_type:complete